MGYYNVGRRCLFLDEFKAAIDLLLDRVDVIEWLYDNHVESYYICVNWGD